MIIEWYDGMLIGTIGSASHPDSSSRAMFSSLRPLGRYIRTFQWNSGMTVRCISAGSALKSNGIVSPGMLLILLFPSQTILLTQDIFII